MQTYTTTGFAGHVEHHTFVPSGAEPFEAAGRTWVPGTSTNVRTGAVRACSVNQASLVSA